MLLKTGLNFLKESTVSLKTFSHPNFGQSSDCSELFRWPTKFYHRTPEDSVVVSDKLESTCNTIRRIILVIYYNNYFKCSSFNKSKFDPPSTLLSRKKGLKIDPLPHNSPQIDFLT